MGFRSSNPQNGWLHLGPMTSDGYNRTVRTNGTGRSNPSDAPSRRVDYQPDDDDEGDDSSNDDGPSSSSESSGDSGASNDDRERRDHRQPVTRPGDRDFHRSRRRAIHHTRPEPADISAYTPDLCNDMDSSGRLGFGRSNIIRTRRLD
ncbi:unnamed protein product [Phytophthora fragariaefolia]|uniref:Unnamed protein product n=1 Tax=Phytophthora fragariaefolia TaxID=1490495 RepID=A0A9W6Y9S7_9STRA|nr:unnamed protein product [Phytophthora fragariaefolia]